MLERQLCEIRFQKRWRYSLGLIAQAMILSAKCYLKKELLIFAKLITSAFFRNVIFGVHVFYSIRVIMGVFFRLDG